MHFSLGNDLYDPKCVIDRVLMEEQAGEYMYFEAIHYINSVRRMNEDED